MKRVLFSCWMLVLTSCADSRPAANGDGCEDGASCSCNDGRPGEAVCDLDTHAFVMCRCATQSQHAEQSMDADAGAEPVSADAAGSGGSGGHTALDPAADGGSGRSARAAGAGGEGAAGHPGKAVGNAKAHGPKH